MLRGTRGAEVWTVDGRAGALPTRLDPPRKWWLDAELRKGRCGVLVPARAGPRLDQNVGLEAPAYHMAGLRVRGTRRGLERRSQVWLGMDRF